MRRVTPIHGRDHSLGGSDPIPHVYPRAVRIFGTVDIASGGTVGSWDDAAWSTAPTLSHPSGSGLATFEDDYFLWDAAADTLQTKRAGKAVWSLGYTAASTTGSSKDYHLEVGFGPASVGQASAYTPPTTAGSTTTAYEGATTATTSYASWVTAGDFWSPAFGIDTSAHTARIVVSFEVVFWDASATA